MKDSMRNRKKKPVRDASFVVRVVSRRNASFQGVVHWLETNTKRSFRSSLEMVALMQQAMDDAGVPESDYTLRSWSHNRKDKEGNSEEDPVNNSPGEIKRALPG